ncbi:ribonuclease E/G [Brevundimonas sp.]|uniref:ribonuclease E/G n=1 Tax=Brevundimonas sp. TaxID=1871086 RepID=UPI002899AE23|nr:ribonuclease E/G [Brevundimonas sp.]
MADVEVFLDETPGETRGVIARDGLFTHLIIQRDSDRPSDRLGARCVGRIARVEPGLRGAFVDLGAGEPFGFLPLGANDGVGEGAKIEVEVVAEPRERKGPVLRRLGEAAGEPRLLGAGPDVATILGGLFPGARPQTGVAAIRAALEAEEDALSVSVADSRSGLDLMIQRTRALIAVDIDHAPAPGRDSRKNREAANRAGLSHTARLLTLKGWGGLVVIDLIGVGLHGDTIMKMVRAAFAAEPQAAFGPLSRFGLMQVSLPWRRMPLDERLLDAAGRPSQETRAIAVVRQLRLAMLSDPATPRFVARCAPDEAARAAPLVQALGPRAGVLADETMAAGVVRIEEAR